MSDEMTVWRIKLNSGCDDVDWDAAKAYCRRRGVVGVGWGRIAALNDGASYEEVIEALQREGWASAGVQAIRTIATRVENGDFIWTRDRTGAHWLGRITGPWRYDRSDEAWAYDVNNLRPCEWLGDSMRDYEVPGAVVRSFVGAASTLRRVISEPAGRVTELIWARATNPATLWSPLDPGDVLTDLIDPWDAEDIALVFLQSQGWILMPSSRMGSTPLYEATLRHQDGGRFGVVAVKSGQNNPVPVPEVVAAVPKAEVFVYSTHDAYAAPPEDHGATRITRQQLVDFMAKRPDLLPPRIAQWLKPGESSDGH